MNMTPLTALSLLSAALLLGGCNRGGGDDASDESRTVLSNVTEKVEEKVRHQMATETLRLNDDDTDAPNAELTWDGTLLIAGEAVAMTEAQRALAMQYRTELGAVAEAGAAVGMQAAELATQAITEAASSLVDSDKRSVEERIAGRAEGVKASALALCEQLPKLLAAQDAFAAAVPEFAPYADLDQSDVDDCESDIDDHAPGG